VIELREIGLDQQSRLIPRPATLLQRPEPGSDLLSKLSDLSVERVLPIDRRVSDVAKLAAVGVP